MQAQTTIEPTGRRGTMLWSAIRGDKCMAGAHPPDTPASVAPAVSHPKER